MPVLAKQKDECLQKAGALLNKALALDPHNLAIHERLAGLYEKQCNNRSAAERLLFLAEVYRERGQLAPRQKSLQKLLSLLPNDVDVLQQMADLHKEEGRTGERSALLERLVDSAFQQGLLARATQACEEILAFDPDRRDIRERLIQIQEKAGSQKEVVSERRALASNLLQQGNVREALEQYRLVLAGEPDDMESLQQVATLHEQIGQIEQAHDVCVRLAELASSRSEAKEVLKWYTQATQVFPNNGKTWQAMADVAEKLEDKDAAIAAYERAAGLLLDSSQPVQAEICLRKIREIAPDHQRSS